MKNDFINELLVTFLWDVMGFNGVFISFSYPTWMIESFSEKFRIKCSLLLYDH